MINFIIFLIVLVILGGLFTIAEDLDKIKSKLDIKEDDESDAK
jgi:hypothetical protein